MNEKYVLEIQWDGTAPPDMPTLVGPFDTRHEAEDFFRVKVPNGSAEIRPLTSSTDCQGC